MRDKESGNLWTGGLKHRLTLKLEILMSNLDEGLKDYGSCDGDSMDGTSQFLALFLAI